LPDFDRTGGGYSAQPFFIAAWRDLRNRQLGMDVPVSLAMSAAFAASVWYTWKGGGEVYYDSVTMFVFFLLTGRFLEMTARHRAGRFPRRWCGCCRRPRPDWMQMAASKSWSHR
jgi:cation transport ATPase